ncbi:MAG: CsgG/HfaB family protein [Desulfurivibrionaceae bacterium]|nr:CsgG/HfaB family protein [Desulfobulbales bacterium]MDT8334395.1 CsgG/HfaB family protein [Desulfurivibrionaceae bacterium]
MKRLLVILILLFLMVAPPPVLARESIAVIDLKPIGVSQSLAEAVSENLRTMLIISGAFRVVERNQLEEILTEYKLAQGGITENSHAIKIGTLAEANLIMIGSITKMFESYIINARLLNVESGVSVLAQRVEIGAEAEFPGKIDELAAFFSKKSVEAPAPDALADISGTYRVKGADYVGRLRVQKHRETYQTTWLIDNAETGAADQAFTGVGILHNRMFSVHYSERDDKANSGVAIYDVLLNGEQLRGLYTSVENSTATGKLRFENGEKIKE